MKETSLYSYARPILITIISSTLLVGPIRSITTLPLTLCAFFSLLLGIASGLMSKRFLICFEKKYSLIAMVGVTITGILLPTILLMPQGLASNGSGDAGNHLRQYYQFLNSNPHIYQNFVGLYGVMGIFNTILPVSIFTVLRMALYGSLLVAIMIASLLIAEIGITVTGGILFLLSFCTIVLPFLYNTIGSGFYASAYAILPLICTIYLYAYGRTSSVRVLSLLTGCVMYRYSYGLNLGDLLVIVCILSIVELRSIGSIKFHTTWLWITSITLLLGAVVVYWKLLALETVPGSVMKYNLPLLVTSECLLSCSLLGLILNRYTISLRDTPAYRVLLFIVLFGGISSLISLTLLLKGITPHYYAYKYPFHTIILFGLFSPWILGHYWEQNWRKIKLSLEFGLAIVLPLTLIGTSFAIAPLFNSLITVRNRRIIYLPQTFKMIQEIVAEKKGSFGGYLTPNWPESNFMNAALKRDVGEDVSGYAFYCYGENLKSDSQCTFWRSGNSYSKFVRIKKHLSCPISNTIDSLEKDPRTATKTYKEGGIQFVLKYLCESQ